jgi:hypothetical protein
LAGLCQQVAGNTVLPREVTGELKPTKRMRGFDCLAWFSRLTSFGKTKRTHE